MNKPTILKNKNYNESSIFLPENLLREARRQMEIPECDVPDICVLDPDGDLAEYLKNNGKARKNPCWACYHSYMYEFELNGKTVGILPCVVGASYATLVAEQLFVSGCELIISITSAGILQEPDVDKKFALITEALRDEGTSYHYLPPEEPAIIRKHLKEELEKSSSGKALPWLSVKSWTTDAPYRETESAMEAMKNEDVTCVEMEASALYSLARVKDYNIICFAHLTNTMAQEEGDFEKGEHFGSLVTLDLLEKVLEAFGKDG